MAVWRHGAASVLGIIFLRYSWLISVPTTIVLHLALMRVWILRAQPAAVRSAGADLATTAGRAWAGVGNSGGRVVPPERGP